MNTVFVEFLGYFLLVILLAVPLGRYIERIMTGRYPRFVRWLGIPERALYRLLGIDAAEEMDWKQYLASVLAISLCSLLALFVLLLAQGSLPLNPQAAAGLSPALAFNTAVSFMTNTNWQAYSGELQLSFFSQVMGLTVQNFVSAGTGLAVLIAFVRGFTRTEQKTLGSFWVDLTRSILFILLPLALVWAMLFVSQGVVQSFVPHVIAQLSEPQVLADGSRITGQFLPLGPVASQTAIQLLGTNGGGFFGANSAHPFANPTPFANLLSVTAILLIPAALCFSFGRMVGNRRQGRMIFLAMLAALLVSLGGIFLSEQAAVPQLRQAGLVDWSASALQSGGNMEGKEVRFGIADSALWTAVTTASSNGSTNSALESYTPLGGFFALLNIQLGSVIFGGIGSGLYSMLAYALLTVFITGLMVGRTPEFLGKKIGPFEMKMAVFICLASPAATLIGSGIAAMLPGTMGSLGTGGPHGFTELLYAYSSAGGNNGSAFGGLQADTVFLNLSLALVMLVGRFVPLAAVLAAGAHLAERPRTAATAGTLSTDTVLFALLLLLIVVLVGVLSFLPALALGPVAEALHAAF